VWHGAGIAADCRVIGFQDRRHIRLGQRIACEEKRHAERQGWRNR
jgi:hypothetical protein